MLSIRLIGAPAEVADAVMTLHETFSITDVKGLFSAAPAQSSVRVYVEVNPAA
ncbi:hypothetical protein [Nonomuraea typhae]|uniref:hypothetical protein n=1 Tax=Nonomuraea typhae TaxID=2603600 RepID=UPI0012F7333D|nr:hypothetical protein [Nonomuraea typhae]